MPRWPKIIYALFLCVLVPVYAVDYPLSNFLWFSDIALLACCVAMWRESPLLSSMMAISVLLPEIVWNASFFLRLLFGVHWTGVTGYMFESQRPLYLRALSLFHVGLPVVLLWLVHRLRYDRRALIGQTLLAWIILPLTYATTRPADDINWVFGLAARPQHAMPPLAYLGILMLAFPVAIYLPTHLLLGWLFGPARDAGR